MIYTIGYARLRPPDLLAAVAALDATVLDCRSVPSSRRPGFSRGALGALLGPRYEWHPELGGRQAEVPAAALDALAARPGTSLLLCLEEAPGDCHRHRMIATRLAVPVTHLYQHELIDARELQRAIDEDDDYVFAPRPW